MYYYTPFGSLLKTYKYFDIFLKEAYIKKNNTDVFSIIQDEEKGKNKLGQDCTRCFGHLKFQCLYDYVSSKCYGQNITNEQKISCCIGKEKITTNDGFVIDCTELKKYSFITLNNKLATMGLQGYKHKRINIKEKVNITAKNLQGF